MTFRDRMWRAFDALVGSEPRSFREHPNVIDGGRHNDALENPMNGFGIEGVDSGASARPIARRMLTDTEIEITYLQFAYGRRVIDAPPTIGTRKGWGVHAKKKRDVMKSFDRALDVRRRMRLGWQMGRMYGASIGVMFYKNGRNVELSEPLDENNPGELQQIQIYDGREFSPWIANPDPWSRDYRMPEWWTISPRTGGTMMGQAVHASRCLYFPGMPVPPSMRYMFRGRDLPVMEVYWDAVRDKGMLDRAAAKAAQEVSVDVFNTLNLREQYSGQDGKRKLRQRVMDFIRSKAGVGTAVIGNGETYERHPLTFTGFADLDGLPRAAMSVPEGYTQQFWFGDPPAGMNTDGESSRQQNDRVTAGLQVDVLDPILYRLYSIVGRGMGIDPDDIEIQYHPLDEPTAAERSTNRQADAAADASWVAAGALMPEDVRSHWKNGTYTSDIELQSESLDDYESALTDPVDDVAPGVIPNPEPVK